MTDRLYIEKANLLPFARLDNEKVARRQHKQVSRTEKTSLIQQLYKAQPQAKTAVEHAAGYAVFNNMGVTVVFLFWCPERMSSVPARKRARRR